MRYGIATLPQPVNAGQAVNFANYLGLAVSNQSDAKEASKQFIIYAGANEEATGQYLKSSGHPPALRSLIAKYTNDSRLGVFAKQSLTARSWPQIDNVKVAEIFGKAISEVLSGRLTSPTAVDQAESQVTALMSQKIR